MIADDQSARRRCSLYGPLETDGIQAANTNLVEPLGALQPSRIIRQLAMHPQRAKGSGHESGQSCGASQRITQESSRSFVQENKGLSGVYRTHDIQWAAGQHLTLLPQEWCH